MDGSRCKAAATKSLRRLFEGTGLDPKDKVRRKVQRLARRTMKRKKDKSTSSSGSSSTDAGEDEGIGAEDALFSQGNKVKEVGDRYPGALSSQALSQMKMGLPQDIGIQEESTALKPVVLQYVRQQLLRRASPPVQRELLTIASAVDLLLRGRVACATDVLLQRLKASESIISGSHWGITQKLELVGKDGLVLTGPEELGIAQKDAYQESRANWLASLPSGQGGYPGKGKNKEDRHDMRKGKGRKGKGDNKGDKNQKQAKDDTTK